MWIPLGALLGLVPLLGTERGAAMGSWDWRCHSHNHLLQFHLRFTSHCRQDLWLGLSLFFPPTSHPWCFEGGGGSFRLEKRSHEAMSHCPKIRSSRRNTDCQFYPGNSEQPAEHPLRAGVSWEWGSSRSIPQGWGSS